MDEELRTALAALTEAIASNDRTVEALLNARLEGELGVRKDGIREVLENAGRRLEELKSAVREEAGVEND
jgi:hypothetical protein